MKYPCFHNQQTEQFENCCDGDYAFLSFVLNIVDPKTRAAKRVIIYVDDGIHPTGSLSDLAKLKLVFNKGGSTTAGIEFISQLHAMHGF